MAEIGAIASIIGIAACGIKLSRVMYQMTTKTLSAGDQINRIAMNVSLFASSLDHLGRVLGETKKLQTEQVEVTVRQLTDRCQNCFDEITRLTSQACGDKAMGANQSRPRTATNDSKMRQKLMQRIKFYFTKSTVEYILAELEYLKTTLSVVLNTLNLAAISAKMQQDQAILVAAEQVRQTRQTMTEADARTQLETLVVARHIAVIVLTQIFKSIREAAQTDAKIKNRSPPDFDDVIESPSPRLLMDREFVSPNSLVKFEIGNISFPDQRDSAIDDSLPLFMAQAPAYVDELLDYFTLWKGVKNGHISLDDIDSPPPKYEPKHAYSPTSSAPEKVEGDSTDSEDFGERQLVTTTSADSEDMSWDVVMELDEQESTQTNATAAAAAIAVTGTTEQSLMRPPPRSSPKRAEQPPRPPQIITSPVPIPFRRPFTNVAPFPLTRTMSVPESDRRRTLPSLRLRPGQDHQDGRPLSYAPNAEEQAMVRRDSQAGGRLRSPSFSMSRTPNGTNLQFYTSTSPEQNRPSSRNYRAPYAEDVIEDSNGSSDDRSGDMSPKNRKSSDRVRSAGHNRNDSFWSLDIPWRIRMSAVKYFDFIDDRIVGPKTPNLPIESIHWIYAQENSCTEILQDWVCLHALSESNYRFTDLKPDERRRPFDERPMWRIQTALPFEEIERLVERTAEIIKAQARPSRPSIAPLSPTATRSVSQGPSQSPLLRVPSTPGAAPPPLTKSVSFAGDAASRSESGRRSPRPDLSPPSSGPPPPRQGPYRGDRSRERDRSSREFDPDEEHARELRRRTERMRRRHDEERRKLDEDKAARKKRHQKLGTTMAKIGGIAALLEGLDGAF